MSLEGMKSFVVSHLNLSGFKRHCERLYGAVFGKLVYVLEALTTALDKIGGSPNTELSFNKSVHKRKASPWRVAVKLHNWHLERYEARARLLMTGLIEKLIEKGSGIQDLSSKGARRLTSELMDNLLELNATVFRALFIAKGRKPGPEDMGQAMGDLFNEAGVSGEDKEKLKALLSEKGFFYQFIRASAQLNVIKVMANTGSDVETQPLAISCLGVKGSDLLHNILQLYYEMTASVLSEEEKVSLQKKINDVSASEHDLLTVSQTIFNRLYPEGGSV